MSKKYFLKIGNLYYSFKEKIFCFNKIDDESYELFGMSQSTIKAEDKYNILRYGISPEGEIEDLKLYSAFIPQKKSKLISIQNFSSEDLLFLIKKDDIFFNLKDGYMKKIQDQTLSKKTFYEYGFSFNELNENSLNQFGDFEIMFISKSPTVYFDCVYQEINLKHLVSDEDFFVMSKNDTLVKDDGVSVNFNYSPLDAISGDFKILTFNDLDKMRVQGIPKDKHIVIRDAIENIGELKKITSNISKKASKSSSVYFLISFDGSITFKGLKEGSWFNVNVGSVEEIKKYAFNEISLSKITEKMFSQLLQEKIDLFVMFDDLSVDDTSILNSIKYISRNNFGTPFVSNPSLYIVNTISKINLYLKSNKIIGTIEDEDKGLIKYRVFLNGEKYIPLDGDYTLFDKTPKNISIELDQKKIILGEINNVVVEICDSYGRKDKWMASFMGNYSGLLFKDEKGNYYSTSQGKHLKTLDFGSLIAGQNSKQHIIFLENKTDRDISGIKIKTINNVSGVKVMYSLDNSSSFSEYEEIDFGNFVLKVDESIPIFVRITTDIKMSAIRDGSLLITAFFLGDEG